MPRCLSLLTPFNFDPFNPAERAPAAARVRFVKKRLSKLTSMFDSTLMPTWLHFGIQNLSKSDQNRPKLGEDGPRWHQHGPRWAKLAPRWRQVGPKMGPRRAKLTTRWAKMGQVGPKMVPRRAKLSPRWVQRRISEHCAEDGQRMDRRLADAEDFKKWRLGPWGGRRGSPKSS